MLRWQYDEEVAADAKGQEWLYCHLVNAQLRKVAKKEAHLVLLLGLFPVVKELPPRNESRVLPSLHHRQTGRRHELYTWCLHEGEAESQRQKKRKGQTAAVGVTLSWPKRPAKACYCC